MSASDEVGDERIGLASSWFRSAPRSRNKEERNQLNSVICCDDWGFGIDVRQRKGSKSFALHFHDRRLALNDGTASSLRRTGRINSLESVSLTLHSDIQAPLCEPFLVLQ